MFDLGVPVFGICYGMQTMAEQLGGKVEGSELREFGYARVDVVGKSRLLTASKTTSTLTACSASMCG